MDTLKLGQTLTTREAGVLLDPTLPPGVYSVQLVVIGERGESDPTRLTIVVTRGAVRPAPPGPILVRNAAIGAERAPAVAEAKPKRKSTKRKSTRRATVAKAEVAPSPETTPAPRATTKLPEPKKSREPTKPPGPKKPPSGPTKPPGPKKIRAKRKPP
jgi:hypothetical protein